MHVSKRHFGIEIKFFCIFQYHTNHKLETQLKIVFVWLFIITAIRANGL